MPGMSGIDVCSKLKADSEKRNIPIIFLSALGNADLKVKALEAGGTDYVTKPVGTSELLARVNTHLNMYRLQQKLKIQAEKLAAEIKERKQAEEDLLKEKTLLKAIIDNIPVMLTRYNPDANMLYLNKEFEKKIGWNTEEVQDIDMMEKVYPDPDYRQQAMDYMLKASLEWREFTVMSKSGEPIDSEWSNFRMKDGTQIGIGIDITERKQAEEEKVQLEAQYRQAQKMESIGRLAGGVAHDFNNALSVITSFSELALDDIDPKDQLHEDLTEILTAARRAADTTRQLLVFARKQNITPIVLDFNESIESTLKILRRLIGEDIALAWLPGSNLWPVKMDPSQIDQILANLCVNARDAIEGVGKISIESKNVTFDEEYCTEHPGFISGEFVQLSLSDSGCGMDKATLDNIFEPFFTTKEMDKGTGLGLATVYGIIKQNNGFINVYSEPDQGTTIKIYLPRQGAKADEISEDSTEKTPSGQGETILVVEDDRAILKFMERNLKELDYTVMTSTHPEKVMDMIRAHTGKIHLLITDVIMPKMNGRDLAQQLQSICPDMKCIYMSGYTADVITDKGVLDKGENFIQKPFSKKKLAELVRNVLDGN
jgi:PAS domain S-box-containing protein